MIIDQAHLTCLIPNLTMKTSDNFIKQNLNKIICGGALMTLKKFPDESIDCIVTSPPYWSLRDYGVKNQIGLEKDFNEYLSRLIAVFDEIKRILKPAGTCWVVLGDTYGGSGTGGNLQNRKKEAILKKKKAGLQKFSGVSNYRKSLLQLPSRFSVTMIKRGWILRNEIIWHKPNVQPSSAIDRFTVDFEKIYFFVKSRKYYFSRQFEPLENKERLKRRFINPGNKQKYRHISFSSINQSNIEKRRKRMLDRGARNKRCVWKIGTSSFSGQHFATFPEKLIETPVKAGCPEGGIVLDPFIGSGTTAVVAKKLERKFIGIELNPEYVALARNRAR